MFLSLDGTFWFQLLNFAIFFAILNVVFLRPVGEAIKKRRAYIDGVQSDFDRYDRQLKTFKADADGKRAGARRDAEETVAKARAAAETEGEAVVAKRGAEAQAIVDDARATVANEVRAAKAREGELAQTLGRTLLDRAIGADR
ncbi:MAG: ATP synthase F0 subunit B [Candidatus Eremiobacteraeota bacterium]|nr:ATP synthase F0 subunit B [Candidatus Eremiobacteraeota bacterium]